MDKLKYYIGCDVPVEIMNYKNDYTGIQFSTFENFYYLGDKLHVTYEGGNTGKSLDEIRFHMRPLSSLTPELIEHMKADLILNWCSAYDVWLEHVEIDRDVNWSQAPFEIVEWLISKHYWIGDQSLFGKSLIEIKD